jgi:hypothetical protein
MKKTLMLLCSIVLFSTGCTLNIPQQTGYRQQVTPRTSGYAQPRDYRSEKQYALQREVMTYAKMIKSSRERCNLTSEEVAYCFSRRMYGNTYDGTNIKVHGDNWHFVIDGFCTAKRACKVIVTSRGQTFYVNLILDKDGYLTVDSSY